MYFDYSSPLPSLTTFFPLPSLLTVPYQLLSQIHDARVSFVTHLIYPGTSLWAMQWEYRWGLVESSLGTQLKAIASLFSELVINSSAVIRISEPVLYPCLDIDRFTLMHTPTGLILMYMPYTTVLLLTLFASRSKEEWMNPLMQVFQKLTRSPIQN